jgi:putative methyltransferase (TIGR04325 family)
MSLKELLKALVPARAWDALRKTWILASPERDSFRVAPDGWSTTISAAEWDDARWLEYLGRDAAELQDLIECVRRGERICAPNAEGQGFYDAFATSLRLALGTQSSIGVLDYGGNLGDYYWLARSLHPAVAFDFHVKELPAVVSHGRSLSNEITWHTTDDVLRSSFDMVMSVSVLEYLRDWRSVVSRMAQAARSHLFLSVIPNVPDDGYVAVQRERGREMHYEVIDRTDLLAIVRANGFDLEREFNLAQHPPIYGARQQPTLDGWLFRRVTREPDAPGAPGSA